MPLAIHIMQAGVWLGDQCELYYLLYMNSCYVILLTLIIINNLSTIPTLWTEERLTLIHIHMEQKQSKTEY